MQAKAFTKGMKIDEQAKRLRQQVGALKYRTLVNMAELISQTSPVDSGNYARNHEVAVRSGSFQADGIRPDSDSRISREGSAQYPNARSEGLEGMMADIQGFGLLNRAGQIRSLADSEQNFVFRNRMSYANFVEREHQVYAQARREIGNAIADAVAQVRR